MKSTEGNASDHWAAGDFVWGTAFRTRGPKPQRRLNRTPVHGMLAAAAFEEQHAACLKNGYDRPRFFVPCTKKGKLSWDHAIPIENRDIADTEKEASEIYEDRIREAIAWHESEIRSLERRLGAFLSGKKGKS